MTQLANAVENREFKICAFHALLEAKIIVQTFSFADNFNSRPGLARELGAPIQYPGGGRAYAQG